MISNDAIRQFAVKHQTSELNVRREYFQHLFLSYFYQQEKSEKVLFKGGTALRLIYRNARFSEDLDFDSMLDRTVIEQIIIAAFAAIEREGIGTELDEAKETTGGYLATARFSVNDVIVPIKIEISFRNGHKTGEEVIISSDVHPDYTVMQLSQTQIVEGKIVALFSRKKPRDFYDFYFLLRANMISVKNKELLRGVLDALQASHIRFDFELKRFLPQSHWSMIRNFKTALEREIKRFL